jgi:hypothetical protein
VKLQAGLRAGYYPDRAEPQPAPAVPVYAQLTLAEAADA